MHSCRSPGKPVRQVREPSEGFGLKHSYYAQEAKQLELYVDFLWRKGGWGQPPVTDRRVGESHEAVKQTDSGLGVEVQAGPEGHPSSSVQSCQPELSHMTLSWVGTPMLAPGSEEQNILFEIRYNIYFSQTHLVYSVPFIENIFLFPMNYHGTFDKYQLTIFLVSPFFFIELYISLSEYQTILINTALF